MRLKDPETHFTAETTPVHESNEWSAFQSIAEAGVQLFTKVLHLYTMPVINGASECPKKGPGTYYKASD